MIGSKAQLEKCVTINIDIAGDVVHCATSIRYLGVFLDETLTFKEHVKRKCRTAMLNVFRVKSIRKSLTKAATEVIVLSLILSHLDYCNLIVYGKAEIELTKLQRIQNMCAKLVIMSVSS